MEPMARLLESVPADRKAAISYLNKVVVKEQKSIGKLSGNANAPTVKEKIKEKKSFISNVRTLLKSYLQIGKMDKSDNRGGTTNKITGETGQKRNASTGRKSKGAVKAGRGGGGGGGGKPTIDMGSHKVRLVKDLIGR